MKISKYQKAKNTRLAKKAFILYKEGLTLRDVADVVGRSHEWVRQEIKKLEHDSD